MSHGARPTKIDGETRFGVATRFPLLLAQRSGNCQAHGI